MQYSRWPTPARLHKKWRHGYHLATTLQAKNRNASAKLPPRSRTKNAWTVAKLADEYFERTILGHWKHPNIVRSRIENVIKPAIGKKKAEDVRPETLTPCCKASLSVVRPLWRTKYCAGQSGYSISVSSGK